MKQEINFVYFTPQNVKRCLFRRLHFEMTKMVFFPPIAKISFEKYIKYNFFQIKVMQRKLIIIIKSYLMDLGARQSDGKPIFYLDTVKAAFCDHW